MIAFEKIKTKQISCLWIVPAVILFLGFGAALGWQWAIDRITTTTTTTTCKTATQFINRRIVCETGEEELIRMKRIEDHVRSVVADEQQRGRAQKISVFFRDLNTVRWFGISEYENYSPGSLLKLPLLIAYLKYAEVNPSILEEKITYKKPKDVESFDNLQNIISSTIRLEHGKAYTVDELLYRMIVDSDNDATHALYERMDPIFFKKVYLDMGVYLPNTGTAAQEFLSAATYSNILRALYNASYLNQAMSEKALLLMSKSTFHDGLQAGAPLGTKIAHKFGERSVYDEYGRIVGRSLHDCGIVYHHQNPYILCVMTTGQEFNALKKTIQNIAQAVWKEYDDGDQDN